MESSTTMRLAILCCFGLLASLSSAFQQQHPSLIGRPSQQPNRNYARSIATSTTRLHEMKRPILDRLATFVFELENDRVSSSSVPDDKGRSGEPMEWAEENSFANRFSEIVSSNDIGYRFKQGVADLVAGEYDAEAVNEGITKFVGGGNEKGGGGRRRRVVAMYSFTTCPFCRKAKDYLEEERIPYEAIELDLLPGNEGNEIRAELGRKTGRTSVPSIFIGGDYIGGCNDGPGLLPLGRENNGEKLNTLLKNAGVRRR